ncbi:MAG: hypothetical protein GX535_18355 [Xanthomonadaceae bacterium]|nr:hypothetical protein [Xanthomonadaceae bacterium]
MRTLLVFIVCWLAPAIAFADDYNRIIRLEQDVRELERQVSTLQREISALRRDSGTRRLGPGRIESMRTQASDAWVDAEKWRRIEIGAREMDVIELLGPPTSMRVQDGSRILLYAMEIGSSGFLSGSVTLRDREVIAIELPTLK